MLMGTFSHVTEIDKLIFRNSGFRKSFMNALFLPVQLVQECSAVPVCVGVIIQYCEEELVSRLWSLVHQHQAASTKSYIQWIESLGCDTSPDLNYGTFLFEARLWLEIYWEISPIIWTLSSHWLNVQLIWLTNVSILHLCTTQARISFSAYFYEDFSWQIYDL